MTRTFEPKIDPVMQAIFAEEQQKLPEDLRVAPPGKRLCLDPDDDFKCTREQGHGGEFHAACGMLGDLVRKWPVKP